MATVIIDCKNNKNLDKLDYAGEILRNGGLVAFPTETVYGLGANGLDSEAIKGIYKAKGRPSDNPLILHIYSTEQLGDLAEEVNDTAKKCIDAFWPGPLTLIMKKKSNVPTAVTGGLDTVGIRMPKNNIALALLKAANVPVAAPSANISGKPSTTTAEHVINDLNGKIDVILDGGSTEVGLESTVLDTTSNPPVILRPGGITLEMLQKVLGEVQLDKGLLEKPKEDFIPKAPGMKYKHYSPDAEVTIVQGELTAVADFINEKLIECRKKGIRAGVLATDETVKYYGEFFSISAGSREKPSTIAENLFDSLREFDKEHIDVVFAEAIPKGGIGLAIMNRMNKAAGFKIINV